MGGARWGPFVVCEQHCLTKPLCFETGSDGYFDEISHDTLNRFGNRLVCRTAVAAAALGITTTCVVAPLPNATLPAARSFYSTAPLRSNFSGNTTTQYNFTQSHPLVLLYGGLASESDLGDGANADGASGASGDAAGSTDSGAISVPASVLLEAWQLCASADQSLSNMQQLSDCLAQQSVRIMGISRRRALASRPGVNSLTSYNLTAEAWVTTSEVGAWGRGWVARGWSPMHAPHGGPLE